MSDILKVEDYNSKFKISEIEPQEVSNTSQLNQQATASKEVTNLLLETEEYINLYKQAFETAGEQDPKTINHLMLAIINLMKIQETIQLFGITVSQTLNISSEKLATYATLMSRIPVLGKKDVSLPGSDSDKAAELGLINQKFGLMMEAVKANKGVEEDQAKKLQSLLSSIKDASSEKQNMISTLIETLKSISQKITANL